MCEPGAKHEVVAQWLGRNLYQNGFAQAVVNGDTKVGNVILRTLDQVRLALGGTQKSRTAANIAIVERLFMRALQQSPALDSNASVQYSIKKQIDGTPFVEVEEDILNGVSDERIPQILSDIIQNKFHNLIRANGQTIGVNQKTNREWRWSKNAQKLRGSDSQAYYDKIRAFNNADELLQASRDYVSEAPKHTRKDNFVEFARGVVDFKVDKQGYTSEVVVGITASQQAYLYDIINIQNKKITEAPNTSQSNSSTDRQDASITDPTVSQNGGGVNTQYMQNGVKNSQSSFEGSDDIAEAVALMEREQAAQSGNVGNVDSPSNLDETAHPVYNKNDIEKGGAVYGEQREETREAFYRRADEEKCEVKQRGKNAFAFTRSDTPSPKARQVERELTRLGIPCVVVDKLEENNSGVTSVSNAAASTARGDAVYVNNSLRLDPKETAGHEAFHFWSLNEHGVAFKEFLQDNIEFSSDEFQAFQREIEEDYFGGEIEIYGDDWGLLTEEIFAHVTGRIHIGDPNNTVHAFLRDYDAVKAAWDSLVDSQIAKANATQYSDNESPPSQDGAGFFDAQNGTQSSFEGSDEIAEAVALMERERAEKSTAPVEENDTLPLSRQSPTAPLTRGAEGEIQQGDAGTVPTTDIPSPLESGRENNPSTADAVPLPLHKGGKGTVSQAQTVDELTAEIGDEAVYRRMYCAAQIDRPPATLEINGQTVNTTAYMDELYVSLPDDDAQLTAYLKEREAEKAAQIKERYERGVRYGGAGEASGVSELR